ncbi:MAG TPA: hypothetical protein VG223_13570 [Solirubrobacteraceae bacterium]|jgi:hypothetical protein|nr:hypothetical protein [Solirubrobacteraceae bacterium]
MQVVVDNREGADPRFVGDLRAALLDAGCKVEMRDPLPQSVLDTTVHFIVEGVAVRVPQETERDDLDVVVSAVRAALARRGEHQRFRAVPVYRGETNQVLTWVDVFD